MGRSIIIAAIAATIVTLIILAAMLAYSIRPALSQKQKQTIVQYSTEEQVAPIRPVSPESITTQSSGNAPVPIEVYITPDLKYMMLVFDQQELQNYLNNHYGLLICVKATDSQGVVYDECKIVCQDQKVYFYDIDSLKSLGEDPYSKVIFNVHECACPACPCYNRIVSVVKFAFSVTSQNGQSKIIQLPYDPSLRISINTEPISPPSSS
ncbi:MAG: hypothetical protein GXO23_02225 [Crenarchaeota archaeon]|nr:hypothetical protein [Thermoproteota archaeon]